MNEPRIIKKYPNRRLYDMAVSSYITLEDVKALVLDQIPIKVIDARSQDDITHSTLLQIIIEQEENGPSLFSTESLQQMIRFYQGSMQSMLKLMFEQGMKMFMEQQALLNQHQTGMPPMNDQNSMDVMANLTQQNVRNWQQLQQEWMHTFLSSAKETSAPDETGTDRR